MRGLHKRIQSINRINKILEEGGKQIRVVSMNDTEMILN